MLGFFRIVGQIFIGLALIALPVLVYNSSALAPAPVGRPLLIAHRGLGQTFSRVGLTGETCTATQMLPPEHRYLENTIDGFRAAFADGADIIEFDVQPTTDGQFVVFHDWTLDCRTNGRGVTREHSLAELRGLDIGFGYTADSGMTFPFRGKGMGLMPTLDEALAAFPDKRFLINIKSDDSNEGAMLAAKLRQLPGERLMLLVVYGGGKAMDRFHADLPQVPALGTDGIRSCLGKYVLLGWLGVIPDECRDTLFTVPVNYASLIWGYPNLLAQRLKANGTTLVLLGDYDGSGFSSGIDDPAQVERIPKRFDAAVWTNRIDLIGPAVIAR